LTERVPSGTAAEHTTHCPECDSDWTYTVISVKGRWVPERVAKRECQPCTERAREQLRLAAEDVLLREKRERQAEEREHRLTHVLDMLADAGVVTPDLGHCTFDNWVPDGPTGHRPRMAVVDLLAAAKAAGPHDPVRSVYLLGDTGRGKSHLAAAALRDCLLDAVLPRDWVVYDIALELIGEIQDCYSSNKSVRAVLEKRKRCGLWILDDFGSEAPSADVVRRMTEIFVARAKRATLVTSNVDPNDLESKNHEYFRLFSRLGPSYFHVVSVSGRDRRMDNPNPPLRGVA
jgi:DNA replication protein DnaC